MTEGLLRPGIVHVILLLLTVGGCICCCCRKRSKKVLVYMKASTSNQIAAALSKLFKDLTYSCVIIHTVPTQYDLPLFAVCPLYSRYEADIDNALRELECKEKYMRTKFVDVHIECAKEAYRVDRCLMNDNAEEQIRPYVDDFYNKSSIRRPLHSSTQP